MYYNAHTGHDIHNRVMASTLQPQHPSSPEQHLATLLRRYDDNRLVVGRLALPLFYLIGHMRECRRVSKGSL